MEDNQMYQKAMPPVNRLKKGKDKIIIISMQYWSWKIRGELLRINLERKWMKLEGNRCSYRRR
jgi:hypothetical protein